MSKTMNYAQICDAIDKLNKNIEQSIIAQIEERTDLPFSLPTPLEVTNIEDNSQPIYIHALDVEDKELVIYYGTNNYLWDVEELERDYAQNYLVEDLAELLLKVCEIEQ